MTPPPVVAIAPIPRLAPAPAPSGPRAPSAARPPVAGVPAPGPPYPEPVENQAVYDYAGVLRAETIVQAEQIVLEYLKQPGSTKSGLQVANDRMRIAVDRLRDKARTP